jgi:hypothetical protein
MSSTTDNLYEYYRIYVDNQRLSAGGKKLMMLSGASFEEFRVRWDNDPLFVLKWDKLFKSCFRDQKLKKILEKNDTDDFEFNGRAEVEQHS